MSNPSASGFAHTTGSPPREAIRAAAEALRAGRLAIIPTETVYGLAVSAGSETGLQHVRALHAALQSPAVRLPTWHAPDASNVADVLGLVSPLHLRMVERLLPGPVRLIVPINDSVSKRLTQRLALAPGALEDASEFGVRVPDHEVARELLTLAGCTVLAERASPLGFGNGRSLDASALATAAARSIVCVDAGPTQYGAPSTSIRLLESGGYRVIGAGALDESAIRRRIERLFLFVCTGNTCRSPMAEAVARAIVSDRPPLATGLARVPIRIASAGVAAGDGQPMTPEAVSALSDMGVSAGRHRSRSLTRELIREAEAIFVMTRSHRAAVLDIDRAAAGKVSLLSPEGRDIPDPIGGTLADYRDALATIRDAVEQRLNDTPDTSPRNPSSGGSQ